MFRLFIERRNHDRNDPRRRTARLPLLPGGGTQRVRTHLLVLCAGHPAMRADLPEGRPVRGNGRLGGPERVRRAGLRGVAEHGRTRAQLHHAQALRHAVVLPLPDPRKSRDLKSVHRPGVSAPSEAPPEIHDRGRGRTPARRARGGLGRPCGARPRENARSRRVRRRPGRRRA